MSDDLLTLLQGGLRLPPNARAALASKLLESIANEAFDETSEAHWDAEIQRRIEDIESGRVKSVPWASVESKLEAMISKHRGR